MDRHLYEYAYLHRRFDHVCRLLEAHADRVLEPATERAAHEAGQIVAHLEFEVGGFSVERPAIIHIEEFAHDEHVARLSFHWEAAESNSLFPTMHADLELYALTWTPKPLTQLAFVGRYRPPLAFLGAAADAVLGRRIAESVVHHFVKDTALRIEHELSAGGIGKYLVAERAAQ